MDLCACVDEAVTLAPGQRPGHPYGHCHCSALP